MSIQQPETADSLQELAETFRSHRIDAMVVETADEAREAVLGLIPEGAELHWGKSKTLEDVGLVPLLAESGKHDALRPRLFTMDRQTQAREMRKMGAAPDYMLGSVAAVTEDGALVAASGTGSQLGALCRWSRPPDPDRRQPEGRARPGRGSAPDQRGRLPIRG